MIKITNLNKYFFKNKSNQIHVINNMSLEFPQTGLVTIFGESGCGKTTLLNVIGGLDDFYNGSIEIDNYQIKRYSSRVIDRIRNEKIGYIFQNYLLLQQRTVYDNLSLLLDMYKLTNEEKQERIDYVLKAVGMLKYKKKLVSQLSGGQQQRVGIARALIKSPSLILADEPTGNLDEKNTIEIMNILKKISKNTLVILVSHEKNIATSYSDYIIEIKDGKLINQSDVKDSKIYSLSDDQNIYLKEYEYSKIENDKVHIDFYSNDNQIINLQIVYKNGKFYIASSSDTIYLDNHSEIKLVDDYKKQIDTNLEVLNTDYSLEKLKYVKSPKLSFKEQVSLACNNLSILKKRTSFLSIILLVMMILILICVQSTISASIVNKQELLFTHSKIYNISLAKGNVSITDSMAEEEYERFFDELIQNNPDIDPIVVPKSVMSFTLSGFSQIEIKPFEISKFSLLTTEQISANDLIYGRMPNNSKEIVVEKWVLENALSSTTLGNFMTLTSFIDEIVRFSPINYNFKIVGIADTDENAVYINKWHIFDIVMCGFRLERISVGSLSELANYVDTSNLSLEDNECYWNNTIGFRGYNGSIILNKDDKLEYQLKEEIFCGESPFDVIVSDNQYSKILKSVIKDDWKNVDVYCDTDEEIIQLESFIESIYEKYQNNLIVSLQSDYNKALEPYVEESKELVSSRITITITIILISVLIVFFSMKSYAMKNIYDISVYRAIGIKKGSIAFIYALEILIISLKTTLVGGILCYLVTNFIASVPIIDMSFAISFETFIICTVGVILINVMISLISVWGYLRLTPSRILTKYDI